MLTGGHLLATSRKATGWHTIARAMPLGLLTETAAAGLLCTLAFPDRVPTPQERHEAVDLARALGFLPLALEQAGAYCHQTGHALGTYQTSLGLVLDTPPEGIDPQRTLARIWHATLAAVEGRDPLAVTLLYTLAWLAPDDIPRALLAPLVPDPITLGNALGVLHTYSMIAFTDDRQGVTIHRLVQTVLRTSADHHRSGTYAPGRSEAEQALRHALAGPHDDAAVPDQHAAWEQLLPHALALAESTLADSPASVETADAFYRTAQYLYRLGREAHTIPLRSAALTQYERVLGDTHPDTLSSRNNLAVAYQSAGDLG
ncbi:tetratricopeptide repeat protein, partial [Streptomyces griseorubiginosus]|uniref:tetratricopeptide repeat protein n=1 Tax=Streptomyces griseorubiginosus TaxID=67304 RepID=UPI001AD6B919